MAPPSHSEENGNLKESPEQPREIHVPSSTRSLELNTDSSKMELLKRARQEARARLLDAEKARAERIEQAKVEAEARRKARFELTVQAKANQQQLTSQRVEARMEARAIDELDLHVVRLKGENPPPNSPRPRSRRTLILSALIFIGIPVLLSSIYYGKIASDQYYSVASYTIVTPNNASSSKSALGGLLGGGGVGGTSTLGLQYIVQNYVACPQILDDIKPHLDIRKIYSNPHVDRFARLDPKTSEEGLLTYWNSMVSVHFDVMTGLSEIRVKAFTPKEAQEIAQRVLLLSEALINRLSDRSRVDAVKAAKDEVEAAHKRVLAVHDQLQAYANSTKQIDPVEYAKNEADIQSTLSQNLTLYKARMKYLRLKLPEDAPSVQQLNELISATETQLSEQQTDSTNLHGKESAIEVATASAKFRLENEFASQAYLSSLQFLEAAQVEASSRTFYLETYSQPQLPQAAVYPWRIGNVFLTLLVSSVVWAIGALVISALRARQ